VPAVGGGHEFALPDRLEPLLAHQTTHLVATSPGW
jgi:hypothetical protein